MLMPANGVTWKEFFLALKERFIKDKLMDVAGSVTFFGVLALFPFLLFLVTLAGLVLQPQQVEQFIREIGNVAPADATRIIAEQIRDIHKSQSVGLLTVGFVGILLLRPALRRVQQDIRRHRRRGRHADVDVDLCNGPLDRRAHQRSARGSVAPDHRDSAGGWDRRLCNARPRRAAAAQRVLIWESGQPNSPGLLSRGTAGSGDGGVPDMIIDVACVSYR